MTDDNGKIAGSIFPQGEGPSQPNVTHAPDAIGPNLEIAIAPVGLLRCAFSVGVLMSAFYCDAQAARIIGEQFGIMADNLDAAKAEMQELLDSAEAVTDTVEADDRIQEATFEVVEEPVEEVTTEDLQAVIEEAEETNEEALNAFDEALKVKT